MRKIKYYFTREQNLKLNLGKNFFEKIIFCIN